VSVVEPLGAKGKEGDKRMTGEGSRFIIFNQPESIRAAHASTINHIRKGKKMKTNHNQLRTALFAVTVLTLLAGGLAHADNIYVSCYGSGTIDKFDSSGNRSVFATGLNHPTGLTFDSRGNIWAAEGGNGTIVKFDSSGNSAIFTSGLSSPQSLAFDSTGNLYAAEYYGGVSTTGTIDKFDSSGNKSVFFTGLNNPEGLTFDSSGNLWASNYFSAYDGEHNYYTNGNIVKFDSSGNGAIFASGLDGLIGLAFDSSSNLYVANYSNGTIDKYDSSGNRTVFATGFSNPYGLSFDSSGNLFMADIGAGIIYKYDTLGNGSIFASGLSQPAFIATQVPEPATLLLLGLGARLCLMAPPRRAVIIRRRRTS
jgi:sugar lactone lactonase YvrE